MFSRRRQQLSLTAVALRFLLALSLWQGPILWGHEHHVGSAGITAHLATFHSGDANAMQLGWHWHLSLPNWDPSQSPEGSDPSPQSTPKIAVSSGGKASVSVVSANVPVESIDRPLCAAAAVFWRAALLASIQAARPPLQTLCRLNC